MNQKHDNKMKTRGHLVESRARKSRGGMIRRVKAFSIDFQTIGTLLSQQMYETNTWANAIKGNETSAKFKLEDNCTAHSKGSPFFF